MSRTLGTWAGLAACCVLLAGCPSDPEPDPTPDAGEPPADAGPDAGPNEPTDAGPEGWDGGSTPLAEVGDAVDPGVLAPCTVVADATCGELEAFDLSACNRDSLAHAPDQGVFHLKSRYEFTKDDIYLIVNTLHLANDGGTSLINGVRPTTYTRDAQSFFIRRDLNYPDGGSARSAYAGCQLNAEQKLTGCLMNCRNGARTALATFEATRMNWREGEQESQGIHLAAEAAVSLGLPVDVYVTQGHAYVVSINGYGRTGGLTVFDVADPAKPVFKKTVTMPGDSYWNGVWAKGNALYVASAARGVLVFDISNPADPQFVSSLPSGSTNVHTVFVESDRLYAMVVNSPTRTLLFDITQPTAPVLLNSYTPPEGLNVGYPHDAFAYQGRLYINHWDLGYVVTDVSDPSDIRFLGKYQYPNQTSHANAVGTFAGRTIAFEGGEGYDTHLRVLDVTEPARIQKIGEWQLRSTSSIHNMVLVGTRLYIAYYHEGVRVLDVSNPTQPKQLAYYNTYRETDFGRGYTLLEGAVGMRVPGDGFVYVVDTSRGLLIFREP